MKTSMAPSPAIGCSASCHCPPRLRERYTSNSGSTSCDVSENLSSQTRLYSVDFSHRYSGQFTKFFGGSYLLYAIGVMFSGRVSLTCGHVDASDLHSTGMQIIHGKVHAPSQYLRDVRLTLNGGSLSVAPRGSSTFEIGPLAPGSYLLQAYHPFLHLPSYSVMIPPSPWEAPHIFALGDNFRPSVRLQLPLVIVPSHINSPLYFAVKPPFSLLLVLQQPLLLVAIACCALLWCLPRLQQYQEEDERQQRQALMQQQEILPGHRFAPDDFSRSQDTHTGNRRLTPSAGSWRGNERDRCRAELDQGRAAREEEAEESLERCAFSKCLGSLHVVGGARTQRVI